VAAKAGHNGEHHNHNDCGSFMLVINDQPMIDEIGAPQYERDFFSAKRYQFLAARMMAIRYPLSMAANNSGVTVCRARAASPIRSSHDEFRLDLTACYPMKRDAGAISELFRCSANLSS
jgi:hypothetical protein